MIIGLDEVGRGALAGPVLVGAVAIGGGNLLLHNEIEQLIGRPIADSKRLTARHRRVVADYVREKVLWGIGCVEASVIDQSGLTAAIRQAAGEALDQIEKGPLTRILADAGLFHPYEAIYPTQRIVRADEQFFEVMLASILAKVTRDTLMRERSVQHPQYNWITNVGYGTAAHRQAIQRYGCTPEHRQTFLRSI